jgi:hypothetical protein
MPRQSSSAGAKRDDIPSHSWVAGVEGIHSPPERKIWGRAITLDPSHPVLFRCHRDKLAMYRRDVIRRDLVAFFREADEQRQVAEPIDSPRHAAA